MSKPIKHDQGKLRIDLIPYEAIRAAGRALMHGAEKYGDWNYLEGGGLDPMRVWNSLQRHAWDYKAGNLIDEESGLPALWHMLACAVMLVAIEERRTLPDYYDGNEGAEAYPFNHLRLIGEETRSLKGDK